jgi:FMN reductase
MTTAAGNTAAAVLRRTIAVTLLVGNPRRGSRTLGVAEQVTKGIRAALAQDDVPTAEPDLVDLAELAPLLLSRYTTGTVDPAVERAMRAVRRPGLLVVASPTFKGCYTGLLKFFVDLLPLGALSGDTLAVPVMTAGWPEHRVVAEAHLRTLLNEVGAAVPARGLTVMENEFPDLDTVLTPWARCWIPILAPILNSHASRPAPASAGGRTDEVGPCVP